MFNRLLDIMVASLDAESAEEAGWDAIADEREIAHPDRVRSPVKSNDSSRWCRIDSR